ncbi:RPM1-interacting protein 4-like protein isoform X2 [Tanacetum coccineum]
MSNVELGDTIEHEEPDDGLVIMKFGDSNDNDPTSGERYTQVFNKAWEDKRRGITLMDLVAKGEGWSFTLKARKKSACIMLSWLLVESLEQSYELFLGVYATRTITNMLFNLIQIEDVIWKKWRLSVVVTLRECVQHYCCKNHQVEVSEMVENHEFNFFLQMGLTDILAAFEGLGEGLRGEDIGEDNMSLENVLRMRVDLY